MPPEFRSGTRDFDTRVLIPVDTRRVIYRPFVFEWGFRFPVGNQGRMMILCLDEWGLDGTLGLSFPVTTVCPHVEREGIIACERTSHPSR